MYKVSALAPCVLFQSCLIRNGIADRCLFSTKIYAKFKVASNQGKELC